MNEEHTSWEAKSPEANDEDLLYFNGIDITSGEYLQPPISAADVCRMAQEEKFDSRHLNELEAKARSTEPHLGVEYGVDPTKLEEAGWGIIFPNNADPAVSEALKSLLSHRQAQAAKIKPSRYKVYFGDAGYQPGESAEKFLVRGGAAPGPVDPDKIPYYLLIAGDPETIPFSFQHDLDVWYGVGRIHFDSIDEYARYAERVVAAETGAASLPRRAVFFATSDDPTTALSCRDLVTPLAGMMRDDRPNWSIDAVLGDDAQKGRLRKLLGGDDSPALLFTGTHGGYLSADDPRQSQLQGGLVCQKRPHPSQWSESALGDFYCFAEDISDNALIPPMITFHFACFGAGTPRNNEFFDSPKNYLPANLATRAFVAQLPKRLLGHPRGGALAVIGHVERAWSCSFRWPGAGSQLGAFKSALRVLMDGHPVGWATEFLNQHYAGLSVILKNQLDDMRFGKLPDQKRLPFLWTANHDARNYAIVGDPAVRLPIGS